MIEADPAVGLDVQTDQPSDQPTEVAVDEAPVIAAPAALKPAEPIAITAPHVLIAMNAVMAEIGITGIGKGRRNKDQGFDFRGIDDVYNELNGIMAKHKLLMIPVAMKPEFSDAVAKSGAILHFSRVTVTFQMLSAVDGTNQMVQTIGEGMDSSDKSVTKAQSSAIKYAALMVFMIPTMPAAPSDNDADETTHQLASIEEAAFHLLRGASADREFFKTTWEKNKPAWKAQLPPPAYARLTHEMKRIAGTYPKEPAEREPARDQARDDTRRDPPREESQQRRNTNQRDERSDYRRDDRDRADTRRPAELPEDRERTRHTGGAPPTNNFGIDDDEIPY